VGQLYQNAVDKAGAGNTADPTQLATAVGARVVDVKLRVFIPSRAVQIPLPIAGDVGFDGDNRDFSYDSGTSRAEMWIDAVFATDSKNPIRIKRRAFGQSAEYVKTNLVDVTGKPFWWKAIRKDPFLNIEALPDRTGTAIVSDASLRVAGQIEVSPLGIIPVLHIVFHINAANPLEPAAPAIDCDLDLFLAVSGQNIITYSLKGTHDRFPAYELYLEQNLVYSYDPTKEGGTPADLASIVTQQVNISWTTLLQGTTV
jgi:hypothetical protein